MCQPSTPSQTTQTTDLPDWAKPYAKDIMAKGAALTDVNQNPYQTYGGERIAGFTPLQQQAQTAATNMQPSRQLGLGTGLAGAAGLGALGTNYQGGNFSGGQFGGQQAAQYMSPYIEQAMQPQLREAERASQILGTQQNAQAVGAGAFGGSRNAIMNAERERNLGMLQGDIRAKGYQSAYEQAANQFNQDASRSLQAQQLGEQSRQYGAGLGMQGLQTALQSANTLGQLGQTQYGQEMGINQLQNQYGTQQQQQAQRPLDMAYQDFLNQQNYPYKQLGFMSDLIRGLPLGQKSTSTVYEGSGSTMGQLAGLGMGAYGMSKMMAGGGLAYADGGVTDPQNVESILSKLSDQQLQQAKEAALNRRDINEAQMIDAEIAQRAAMRGANPQMPQGIAPAVSEQFANDMEQNMATGGIVAFADGDLVSDPMGMGASEISESATAPYGRSFMQWLTNEPEWKAKLDAEKGAKKAPEPKAKPPTTSTAGGGRGSRQSYAPLEEAIKEPVKPARSLEEVFSGPKPSKAAVKSAVEQLAEQQGLAGSAKDDVMANALKIREEFDKQNKPILDKLNAAIEAQKPDEQALKDRGFNQALTQFGFGLAERASKPGARFLESASGASPVIGNVLEKTNALIDTQKQNHAKLQMDQARYEVSLAKGDMQTAATLAGQIRQSQQQDKLLQFQIAKAKDDLAIEKQKLAQQATYQQGILSRQPETLQGLAAALEKATPEQRKFLEQAANIRYGTPAGIGAVEKNKAAFISGMKEIDTNYPPLLASRDPKTAAMREQAIRELRVLTNMTGAASNVPEATQDGFGPMKVK